MTSAALAILPAALMRDRDAKRNLSRAGRLAFGQAGRIEQGTQAKVLHLAQSRQAEFHDHPVFALQRNDVRYRGNRHQL